MFVFCTYSILVGFNILFFFFRLKKNTLFIQDPLILTEFPSKYILAIKWNYISFSIKRKNRYRIATDCSYVFVLAIFTL